MFMNREWKREVVYKTEHEAVEEAKRFKNFFYPDKLPQEGRQKIKFFRRTPVENVKQIGPNKWVLEKKELFEPLKFKNLH